MEYLDHYIKPDGWRIGERLQSDCGYKDDSFPGCQYRLPADNGNYSLAVNIKITGRQVQYHFTKDRIRCKIEFVGDGEESTFTGGWLYFDN